MTTHNHPFTSSAQGATLASSADDSSPEFEARIAALWVFPVKSCAGISVTQAVLTQTGLAHDRNWMVVDAEGEMVTQRDLPRMALIQPQWAESGERGAELVLTAPGVSALPLDPLAQTEQPITVHVWNDRMPAFDMGADASVWLTAFLGNSLGPLRLVRFDENHQRPSSSNWTQGLPSSNQFSDGFPVLVASIASLEELNRRLLAQGEAAVDMRRFRANVVLDSPGAELAAPLLAHDEDRIGTLTIHTATQVESVEIVEGGLAQLQPVKPCPRCPMPNIDPDTASVHTSVSDTLQTYRQDARVQGALTFGMNCLPVAGLGQVLRVGQRVTANWAF